ncbi:MAG: hypothetical protein SFV22_07645 [Saprospiraceae bacterium]|nr:hypothetical protein [Saprospiraceae bacterium]
MLGIFRNNPFTIAIPLAFYVALLHASALSGHVPPASETHAGGSLYQAWFLWIAKDAFWSPLTALLLVIVQAILVNMLADNFRLLGERNWFPGLFYGLAASALPEFLYLNPALVATTFVPVSLWRIFNAYQKPQVTAAIFDGAFWLSVASLFYPPILWLLIAAYAGYEVVRVFRMQERLVFLAGAFVPLFLGWVWNFWFDMGAEFRTTQWGNLFQFYRFDLVMTEKEGMKTVLMVAFAVVFVGGLGAFYSRKGIQAQKFVSVLYWFLAIGGATAFFHEKWHWEHFLLPAAVMGILLALSFQGMRNRLLAEVWHALIFGAVLLLQYFDSMLPLFYSIL